jgi:hypothetical protein
MYTLPLEVSLFKAHYITQPPKPKIQLQSNPSIKKALQTMLMLYFCFSQRSHILAIPLYKRLRNLLGLEGCIFWPQETCISASWAGAKERQ